MFYRVRSVFQFFTDGPYGVLSEYLQHEEIAAICTSKLKPDISCISAI